MDNKYAQYSGIKNRAKKIPVLFGLIHKPNQNSVQNCRPISQLSSLRCAHEMLELNSLLISSQLDFGFGQFHFQRQFQLQTASPTARAGRKKS